MSDMKTVDLITCGLLLALPSFGQTPKQPDSQFDITLDDVARERHYNHPLRPQLHYTPLQGHIGDATGLFYYAGEYHLFYMYDQWSRRRQAHKIRYSPTDQKLRVGGVTAPLALDGKRLKLRILLDRSSIDVFADRGQVTVSAVKLEPQSTPLVTLVSEGGRMRVPVLQAKRLESIWTGRQ